MKKTTTISSDGLSNWFLRNWKTIVFIVIIVLAVWFFLNRTSHIEKRIDERNAENAFLEKKTDSLFTEISKLQESRKNIQAEYEESLKKISSIDAELNKIKKEKNEKNIIIDGYTLSQLQEFFAKRYPE